MQTIGLSLWLAGSLLLYWRSWSRIAGTTLETAWRWGWWANLLWASCWLLSPSDSYFSPQATSETARFVPSGLLDQLWYGVTLLVLAGLVSVLGAKRPGSRVWTWFVTVPMLCVLGWPAIYPWFRGYPPQPLRLMSPALCAYTVVCVMGLGNYVGTRLLLSACCMGIALGLLIIPYAGSVASWLPSADSCRTWASLWAGLAIIWPAVLAPTIRVSQPWDRVWVDFVNSFGIVWGRRLQDRFNETARQGKWGVKLDLYGLTWDPPQAPDATPGPAATLPDWKPEMTAALQWLLRRFVDQPWLEQRVGRLPPDASGR